MFQSFSAVGRMGGDPITRTSDKGTMVSFSLAVNEGFGDRKVTEWMACSVIGSLADNIATYGKKGRMIAIEGRWRSYEGKTKENGDKVTKWNIRVNFARFIDAKPKQ